MGVGENIIFDRPDLTALQADNPGHAFVDMHHHTQHSDSYSRVKAVLRRAKAKGVGVAITDHNNIAGSVEAVRLAGEGQLVIPGIEVGCKEGPHFLVYFYNLHELAEFYDRYVQPYKNNNPFHNLSLGMEKLLAGAKKYNTLVAAAHPYAPRYFHLMQRISACKVNPEVLRDIDAVEVCSGQSFRSMNQKSALFAKNMEKSAVGGSDGHVLSALGSTVTQAKASTVAGFLRKVKKQQNRVVGWEMPLVQRVHPYSGMSIKYLRYPSTIPYYYQYHVKEALEQLKPRAQAALMKAGMVGMFAAGLFFKKNF